MSVAQEAIASRDDVTCTPDAPMIGSMRYPPRLSHLCTRPVLVSKLVPTYALAHHLDDEEARLRLDRALTGALREDLLAATWDALVGGTKRLKEEGLLEKVAKSLQDRPERPGRVVDTEKNPAWSAFLILTDVHAGTASDAARRVLESAEGQKMAKMGLDEVGKFLAKELTR